MDGDSSVMLRRAASVPSEANGVWSAAKAKSACASSEMTRVARDGALRDGVQQALEAQESRAASS